MTRSQYTVISTVALLLVCLSATSSVRASSEAGHSTLDLMSEQTPLCCDQEKRGMTYAEYKKIMIDLPRRRWRKWVAELGREDGLAMYGRIATDYMDQLHATGEIDWRLPITGQPKRWDDAQAILAKQPCDDFGPIPTDEVNVDRWALWRDGKPNEMPRATLAYCAGLEGDVFRDLWDAPSPGNAGSTMPMPRPPSAQEKGVAAAVLKWLLDLDPEMVWGDYKFDTPWWQENGTADCPPRPFNTAYCALLHSHPRTLKVMLEHSSADKYVPDAGRGFKHSTQEGELSLPEMKKYSGQVVTRETQCKKIATDRDPTNWWWQEGAGGTDRGWLRERYDRALECQRDVDALCERRDAARRGYEQSILETVFVSNTGIPDLARLLGEGYLGDTSLRCDAGEAVPSDQDVRSMPWSDFVGCERSERAAWVSRPLMPSETTFDVTGRLIPVGDPKRPKTWAIFGSNYLGTGRPRFKDTATGLYWVEQADGSYMVHADLSPTPARHQPHLA